MRQCPKCGKRFLESNARICDVDGAILDLQDGETEPTPGDQKASNISVRNFFCHNSFVSVSICFAK